MTADGQHSLDQGVAQQKPFGLESAEGQMVLCSRAGTINPSIGARIGLSHGTTNDHPVDEQQGNGSDQGHDEPGRLTGPIHTQ